MAFRVAVACCLLVLVAIDVPVVAFTDWTALSLALVARVGERMRSCLRE